MKKSLTFALALTLTAVVVGAFIYQAWPQNAKTPLVPPAEKKVANERVGEGVGVGWSVQDDPAAAVAEAINMARQRMGTATPKFAYAVFTVDYDPDQVIGEFRKQLDPSIRIHGLTSAYGIMTNEGLHKGKVGAVAIMLIGSDRLDFGTGMVDLDQAKTPEEAGQAAIRQAIKDAGRTEKDIPNFVIINGTPRRGDDMEVLDGIADVIGKDTLVIGGTSGNDTNDPTWRQFTRQETLTNGLLLTAVYTDRKVGWAFESDFKVTDKSGIVNKSQGKIAYEINGRPALDVYNEWLGGGLLNQISKLSFIDLMKVTALNPLGRVIRNDEGLEGIYTIQPSPTPDNLKDRALPLAAAMPQGSEIRLLAATWQTIMNRAENIPRQAFIKGAMTPQDALFGIMIICRGAAYALPETELPKIPVLTDNVVEGMPFIGVISRGEQGLLEGIRNVNANLVESMVVVGQK
jgi:hypothetical protein